MKVFKRTSFCLVFSLCLIQALISGQGPVCVTAASAEPMTLVDMAGRTVILKKPAVSLVTTFKPASLCVFSLGLAPRLVGVDTSFRNDTLARGIFPEIAAVPGVGTKSAGINVESVVNLKPDLVILYSQKDGATLADHLAGMGIPAIVIVPETFETIQTSLRLIARATDVGQRLETINQQMNQVLRKVTERVAEIPVDKRKTAYFASSQGIFTTTTGNMLQHEIFTRAGLINVSGSLTGYFQAVSPEQLVRWNPDIIVLSQHLNKGESRKLSDPVLKTLSAVAARQVFRCPSNISPWDFPSPLSVLATVWMAQKAYPEIFHDVDLQKEADQFHHTLFGKTMTQMGGTILDPVEF